MESNSAWFSAGTGVIVDTDYLSPQAMLDASIVWNGEMLDSRVTKGFADDRLTGLHQGFILTPTSELKMCSAHVVLIKSCLLIKVHSLLTFKARAT